jgi:hypothetical protein
MKVSKNIPLMILLGTGCLCCWKTTRPTSHQPSARERHVGTFYYDVIIACLAPEQSNWCNYLSRRGYGNKFQERPFARTP